MDNYDNEEILMGKGIGFHRHRGEQVDEQGKIIDKIFIAENKAAVKKYQDLFQRISLKDIQTASDIVSEGNKILGNKLASSIIFALADHINLMVKRIKNNVIFSTPLQWDLKVIYPNEYHYAQQTVAKLRNLYDLDIPEQEVAFIALYFICAQFDVENMEETFLSTKIIQNVIDIVTCYYGKPLNESSYAFSQFVTHIRNFVMRQLHGKTSDGKTSMLRFIEQKYPHDYQCALKISKFLHVNYHWDVKENELVYLTLHLNRLSSKM